MSDTFLTHEEVSILTGRRAHKLQIEVLRKQGLLFFLNARAEVGNRRPQRDASGAEEASVGAARLIGWRSMDHLSGSPPRGLSIRSRRSSHAPCSAITGSPSSSRRSAFSTNRLPPVPP